jgi:hypothetical protein
VQSKEAGLHRLRLRHYKIVAIETLSLMLAVLNGIKSAIISGAFARGVVEQGPLFLAKSD